LSPLARDDLLISGADAGLGAGGGKNYFSAVRDYVQRLGSFAIEYITFRGGQKERRGADDKEH